ncbi:hypothetical protein KAR91_61515 [Candidatus Pacearchaeota archaeon]|nr:hypothetical protein [Candidatus Pacearchaeota archaeon]
MDEIGIMLCRTAIKIVIKKTDILIKLEYFSEKIYETKNIEDVISLGKEFNDFKESLDYKDCYFYLMDAISFAIFQRRANFRKTEFDLHEKFRKKIKTLIPNATIIKKKNNAKNMPDFWIKKDNLEIPVEIKLNNFNESAKKQLLRYMNFYNCNFGYAVAEKQTIDLPKNIKFIQLSVSKD